MLARKSALESKDIFIAVSCLRSFSYERNLSSCFIRP